MSRLSNSWRLVKASWAVLRSDKELIIFPIVSGIATLIVFALFAVPLWISGYFDRLEEDANGAKVSGFIVLFAMYVVLYTIINYCNAALVGAALIRLGGGDPTARDGFKIASQHMGPIVGYALIGATVGVALQALRERAGFLGQLVAWLGQTAWNITTFLVIPVLVVEGIGPIEAVKRSASLLKRTWGEQIVGNAGIGLVFGLIAVGALLAGGALVVAAAATGVLALIVLAVLIAAAAFAAIIAVGAALKGIFTAALYRYAAEGQTDSYFASDLVKSAFSPKR
ncbi:MAG: hypothetical protein QOF73_5443 [Thermomicrobiales bacterium]|nr:hypothetical protein [Thermomicrobiales bacterium]